MSTSRFSVSHDGGVATVVFDDGGMNLLSAAALRELLELIPALRHADAVLFRSGRSRVFAAGADMAEMQQFDGLDAMAFSKLGQEVFAAWERLDCPTVAFVDGDCFGGALDLILSFDLRCATTTSRFSHPGARIGIVTGFGGTSRWRGLLAPPAARQLFLANRLFTAAEALELSLLDRIVETPAEIVRTIAAVPRETFAFVKQLTVRCAELPATALTRLAQLRGSF